MCDHFDDSAALYAGMAHENIMPVNLQFQLAEAQHTLL